MYEIIPVTKGDKTINICAINEFFGKIFGNTGKSYSSDYIPISTSMLNNLSW